MHTNVQLDKYLFSVMNYTFWVELCVYVCMCIHNIYRCIYIHRIHVRMYVTRLFSTKQRVRVCVRECVYACVLVYVYTHTRQDAI
jgi:hypothetical protein